MSQENSSFPIIGGVFAAIAAGIAAPITLTLEIPATNAGYPSRVK